jgi:hypothetical protein
MEGAADRAQEQRAMIWWGAMMPHLKKPPEFREFVSPKPRHERQSPDVLQVMCEALAAAWGAKRAEE